MTKPLYDIEQAKVLLKKYYNYESFRFVQEDVIASVLSGKDTLALLPTSAGKALHQDTEIPTPYGWTTMGDLKVGDVIFGRDGKVTTVTNKFQPKVDEHFVITFKSGMQVKACKDHLWNVKINQSDDQTVDTKTLYKALKSGNCLDIRSTMPVEYPYNSSLFAPIQQRTSTLTHYILNKKMPENVSQDDLELIAFSLGVIPSFLDEEQCKVLRLEADHTITDIQPIIDNPDHYFCITVDNSSSLFLITREFIPTHNSVCYQIPSLMFAGITVVISPLISLQEDQVSALEAINIPVGMLNSAQGVRERARVEKAILEDQVKILYVAPETLFTESCQELLKYKKVSLIAVDEAHCFAGTTTVNTNKGSISFSDLYSLFHSGDRTIQIKSMSLTTHQIEYKPLLNVYQNPKAALMSLDLGVHGRISATPNHVFFTSTGERQAKDIRMGTTIYKEENGAVMSVLVQSVTLYKNESPHLYDIEVADNHNYFVDSVPRRGNIPFKSAPILVHNCTSVFGDFRSSYEKLHEVRSIPAFASAPVLALTATADDRIKQDIIKNVGLKKGFNEFTMSFDRPSINYHVINKIGDGRKQIIDLIKLNGIQSSGIIYCMTKAATEELAKFLNTLGFNALAYHASVPNTQCITDENGKKLSAAKYKKYILQQFLKGDVKIVVATIAFGMGVDHRTIRWVIHYDTPHNLENYSQECGRASRDGKPSSVYLLYDRTSYNKAKWMINKSTTNPKRLSIKLEKLNTMHNYAMSPYCRRQTLLSYFGEEVDDHCGTCDNCGTDLLNTGKINV